jgi:hypothetical protein
VISGRPEPGDYSTAGGAMRRHFHIEPQAHERPELGSPTWRRGYRLTLVRRLANAAIKPLIRLGLSGRHTYILTVRGRKTGQLHSTPVTLVEDAKRWLVAPYGEVAGCRMRAPPARSC